MDEDVPYCWNSCGKPAVAEKFEGFIDDKEIVHLVCYECAHKE